MNESGHSHCQGLLFLILLPLMPADATVEAVQEEVERL